MKSCVSLKLRVVFQRYFIFLDVGMCSAEMQGWSRWSGTPGVPSFCSTMTSFSCKLLKVITLKYVNICERLGLAMRKLDWHSPFSCCAMQCESVWKKVMITLCVYDVYKPHIISPKSTTCHKEIMMIAWRVHCIMPRMFKISINFLNYARFTSVSTPLKTEHCHRYPVTFIQIYIYTYKLFLTICHTVIPVYKYVYTVCTYKLQLLFKELLSAFPFCLYNFWKR